MELANDLIAITTTPNNTGMKEEERNINDCICLKDLHSKSIVSIKYSENGKYLATASADKKSSVISFDNVNADTGKVLRYLEGEHKAGLNDCLWIGNSYIATSSDDKFIKIWDLEHTPSLISIATSNIMSCLTLNPVNSVVYGGGYDGQIQFFDINMQRSIRSLEAHSEPISFVDCHLNGWNMSSCSIDGLVRLWDVRYNIGCLYTMGSTLNSPIASARYSENGKFLLVTSLDSYHRLYNVEGDPILVGEYSGHKNNNFCISSCFHYSDSRQYIISGSETGDVYMWDINERTIYQQFKGHTGTAYSVASTSGQIASAGEDGAVRIWKDDKI